MAEKPTLLLLESVLNLTYISPDSAEMISWGVISSVKPSPVWSFSPF